MMALESSGKDGTKELESAHGSLVAQDIEVVVENEEEDKKPTTDLLVVAKPIVWNLVIRS